MFWQLYGQISVNWFDSNRGSFHEFTANQWTRKVKNRSWCSRIDCLSSCSVSNYPQYRGHDKLDNHLLDSVFCGKATAIERVRQTVTKSRLSYQIKTFVKQKRPAEADLFCLFLITTLDITFWLRKKTATLQNYQIFRSQVSTIISKTACPAYQTAQGAYQLNISPSHYAKHLQTILVHMEKYIFSQLMSAHQQVPQYLPLFVWNRVGSL